MPRRSIPDAFSLQIGIRIRALRYERGMSLADLAEASNLSKGHLSTVEHGLGSITAQTIERLARGLGVPPMYLLAVGDDERVQVAETLRSIPTVDVKKIRRQIQAQARR